MADAPRRTPAISQTSEVAASFIATPLRRLQEAAAGMYLSQGEAMNIQCDESCHHAGEDACLKCDSLEWEQMCDTCRSYAAEDATQ